MKKVIVILLVVLLLWVCLTLFTQYSGRGPSIPITSDHSSQNCLIVYNPDPFYNFDFLICDKIAEGLKTVGFDSQIMTLDKTKNVELSTYELIVICSNTYNFSPDWSTQKWIKEKNLLNKKTIAVTLGAGSTKRSKDKLEKLLLHNGASVIESKSFWLMKPNDQEKSNKTNEQVALEMAFELGRSVKLEK